MSGGRTAVQVTCPLWPLLVWVRYHASHPGSLRPGGSARPLPSTHPLLDASGSPGSAQRRRAAWSGSPGELSLWRDLLSAQTPTMLYNLRLLTPSRGRGAGDGVGVFCKHLKQLIFKKSQL